MKIGKTTKKLIIAIACIALSFVLFMYIYAASFWGGSGGDNTGALIINAILLLAGVVFLLSWLWDVLKLTFTKREPDDSDVSEGSEQKKDLVLLAVSVWLFGTAVYNIYYLERISEIVKTEVLYAGGVKTLAIIVGAFGIWLHRRWGAFILIFTFSIITIPQILPFISRLPEWNGINVFRFSVSIALIIILSIKFKGMK